VSVAVLVWVNVLVSLAVLLPEFVPVALLLGELDPDWVTVPLPTVVGSAKAVAANASASTAAPARNVVCSFLT
jgi:hypothetical protein